MVIRADMYARKPGAKKSVLKSSISLGVCSCGPYAPEISFGIWYSFGVMLTVESNDSGTNLAEVGTQKDEGLMILTIQRAQPSHPKKVSFSLRKMEDRMAHITTDSAPIGVLKCHSEDMTGNDVFQYTPQ